KDVSSGSSIVQQYALINVKQYNNNKMGANGRDLAECLSIYKNALESTGIKVDINPEDVIDVANKDGEDEPGGENETTKPVTPGEEGDITGKVAEIREAVKGGETYYYIRLESADTYYAISASKAEDAVILNKGDSVTIKASGSGRIVNADSLKIN
ncbi:MAG: hypothetical protein IKS04_00635, partial [Clostridia bacterium]|nr:hypothetical protein [Clostridia bacterium]